MDIVSRLKSYMDYLGMPTTQFADIAKIPRPTISQILSGRNRKVSNELIGKLHAAYPRLNVMWLLFGDGEMEIAPNTQISEAQKSPGLFDTHAQDTDTETRTAEETPIGTPKHISFQNSEIDGFEDNRDPIEAPRTPTLEKQHAGTNDMASMIPAMAPDSQKKIQSIMVFYSDNSFEIFTPSRQ